MRIRPLAADAIGHAEFVDFPAGVHLACFRAIVEAHDSLAFDRGQRVTEAGVSLLVVYSGAKPFRNCSPGATRIGKAIFACCVA